MQSKICLVLIVSVMMTGPGSAATPPDAEQAELLKMREAVWLAWFNDDQSALKEMLPSDLIAINNGEETWQDATEVMKAAKSFQQAGSKLVSLKFPRTKIQKYGDVVIFYSLFEMTMDVDGKRSTSTGRATEIFARRQARWVNTGWHLDSGK